MRTYAEHIGRLASLKTFDQAAFAPDVQYSRQLCEFVLSLALAFNDFHDLLIAHDFLNGAWPADDSTPSQELGEFNGLTNHLFRLHLATLHEVLELIAKNAKVLKDPAFTSVIAKMTAKARTAWSAMVAVATGGAASKSDLARFLLFARNKVAFHYDPDQIGTGYNLAFGSTSRRPYVSRGGTFGRSRFYFGDDAAQEYLRKKAQDISAPDAIVAAFQMIGTLAFAIHQVVFTFITTRARLEVPPAAN